MQTARYSYSITFEDAEIIRELIAFLGEDVFDQRRKDGVIAKSDAFQRRISEVRNVLKMIGAYDGARISDQPSVNQGTLPSPGDSRVAVRFPETDALTLEGCPDG
ncbi:MULTISPECIES: hypothetical protein [unclassified Rhizobium]|jgi:hypothetical protein|uniref:hypothetical protein n=1 Tax=unclassified Rhizobium TaxID=2613769 RepID=UPI000646E3D7|nr:MULTISPECIES: hypothetical protein [unclassified Rhizobium]MBN8954198.1 hypothetical protein [Rhizobium tropici]OJY70909.1 MAG: hypothetical protein BGP09_04325 [Rhizobium sp. 60-20]RKD50732.1 hypothetical protein BJ928_12032 [Rhizobium sp. WW_1]